MLLPSVRSRVLLASLFLGAVTLTGCSEDRPTRAGTIDDPEATAAADATAGGGGQGDSSEENDDADLSRAGRLLKPAEAKAALPGVGVLPAGWSVDPENTLSGDDEDDGEDDVIRPERCEAVFNGLDDLEPEDPAAKAEVTFTAGMLGPWLGVSVTSHNEMVPGDQFSRMLTALGECPKFSVDDGDSVAQFQASALSFPNFGEESAALRMTGTADDMSFGMDLVVIRAGHNLVSVTQMGLGGAGSVKPLQKAARATMRNLNK